MREVLEFAFEDAWHFIGCCVFMMLVALWKPVEINIVHGILEDDDDADQA